MKIDVVQIRYRGFDSELDNEIINALSKVQGLTWHASGYTFENDIRDHSYIRKSDV